MKPYRVLMVCLGNICRSPLAEGILKSKLDATKYEVDSAGTAAYHIGKKPDSRSIAVARKHGIDLTVQRARQFVVEDFQRFNHIYVMDQSNYDNVLRLSNRSEDISKVSLILNETYPGKNLEVPDPYYGGDRGFDHVYEMLDEATDNIIKKLAAHE